MRWGDLEEEEEEESEEEEEEVREQGDRGNHSMLGIPAAM